MRIYTRRGDDGTTALFGGSRVSKADLRVDAYGSVDEANAVLGLARSAGLPPAVDDVLRRAQAALFQVGASLATPAQPAAVEDEEILALEAAIDTFEAHLPPLKNFVLPGGSEAAARIHLARTVCRRAERLVVALSSRDRVDASTLRYLNRLSDLLFVLAREVNRAAGVADVLWRGSAP